MEQGEQVGWIDDKLEVGTEGSSLRKQVSFLIFFFFPLFSSPFWE